MSTLMIAPRVMLFAGTPSNTHSDVLALETLPSRAFGDGSHPTTRLSAGAVDLICRTQRPEHVLDVGTGTGVLARIALARGVKRVVATDIDPEALTAARNNTALDKHDAELVIANAAPDTFGLFQLVIANIIEPVLLELAPAITRALAPSGVLLLSGFMVSQAPMVRTAFCAQGLSPKLQAELDGWALLQLVKAQASH